MSWRLYVDIGNTAVKYGARQDGDWVSWDTFDHGFQFADADDEIPAGELLAAFDFPGLEVVMGCGAEEIIENLEEALAQDDLDLGQCSGIGVSSTCEGAGPFLKLLDKLAPAPVKLVGKQLKPTLKSTYVKPTSLGADRWANAVAAVALHGAPVVALDAGSCLTSTVVNAQRVLVGGNIGAGFGLLSVALMQVSDQLAKAVTTVPKENQAHLMGQSTAEALHAGTAMQLTATAKAFVDAAWSFLGQECPVVVAGGTAHLVLAAVGGDWLGNPMLTLEGIRLMDHYD